ncbi:hypothetical protein VZT92_007796 [Zoarces viviparus]|uniref:Transmembrane protein n=1 Tax=Zoarces viviparus TaxID=48416 RepID=A0AAW1FMI4_ZOAVI
MPIYTGIAAAAAVGATGVNAFKDFRPFREREVVREDKRKWEESERGGGGGREQVRERNGEMSCDGVRMEEEKEGDE